ncbi:MAG: AGE family epimerase/isomerase [Clostridiales bacterium]|nr:AGE family epimerase/isomerase [Clostridiales bacterium]
MLSQIISFWRGLRDDEHGGYYGYMDFDLQVDKTADKGTILNSRILWFFSKAAVILEDSGLLEEARHAYRFLTERCLDKEHGGVYWSVRHDGAPADTTKHTYNQAFAIYALSAYYQATGDLSARSLIIDIYCLIETHCADKYGYIEAFSRDFKPVPNDKLSENGVMADKTMNTLLHLAEAYASYVEAETPQKKYSIGAVSDSLRHILDIFLQKVYNSELHRNEVFFDAEMAPLKRDGRAFDLHSYGHDIEASWLLDWAASLAAPLDLPLDDDEVSPPDLARTVRGATGALAENVYQRAFHNRSLWNECENGRPDETRVWWVQAEGVVGFVNAYQRTGDPRFFRAAEEMLEYIQTYLVDKRPGSEWFWDVDGNGAPSSGKPIVEPWKCPYHNGRMCLEILRRG